MISLTAILDLMFDSFDVGKVLVIGPLRVCASVWPEEHTKWDGLDFLKMSVIVGSFKQREAALRAAADIYVINRDVVPWLVEKYGGSAWKWDMLVIDELSSFKNPQAKRFKNLLMLIWMKVQ